MKKAILATKVGMTQIFNEDGVLTPVTVLQAGPCVVTQVKTVENDGYDAVQVGFADIKEKLVSKPVKGHFDKAEVPYKRFVREFKFENASEYSVKDEIKADIFAACSGSARRGSSCYGSACSPASTPTTATATSSWARPMRPSCTSRCTSYRKRSQPTSSHSCSFRCSAWPSF